MIPSVESEVRRLENKLSLASSLSEPVLLGEWGRYVCVCASGALERAYFEIFLEYVRRCSNNNVYSFCGWALSDFQNPNSEKIVQWHMAFSSEWGKNIKAFLDDEERKSAISSIVSNRHNIAHGKTCTVTVSQVAKWSKVAIEAIRYSHDMIFLR
jgi:hypothetical protein